MINESRTSNTNSLDSIFQRPKTVAPKTLRTPISFVFCSATKEASANKPRHEMNIARPAKMLASFPICSSARNFSAKSVSTKVYSNGLEGLCFLKTGSILAIASFADKSLLRRIVMISPQVYSRVKIVGCTGI